ncbi:MAG: copper-binding protein [Acidobacteriia bacterium]|nr:copper-binding protein [Terriglobia bacterium]
MTRRIVLLLAAATLISCGSKSPPKTYAMQGQVKALDPSTRTATIQHGKIGDWMEAMTMEYKVKPDAEFQKLHVGDRIQARVVVADDLNYYVTEVKPAP